jgi:hypothetical protein
LPSITLAMVDNRDQKMDGPQVTRSTVIQADCWALKSIDAHTLAEAVIVELQPALTVGSVRFLGAFLTSTSSSEDTDNGLVYRVMVRGRHRPHHSLIGIRPHGPWARLQSARCEAVLSFKWSLTHDHQRGHRPRFEVLAGQRIRNADPS